MNSLMLSAQRGHTEVVNLLIAAKAELNSMTDQMSTALMLAVKRGNIDCVRSLVLGGAEFFFRNARGISARDLAIRKALNHEEYEPIVDMLRDEAQLDMVRRKVRSNSMWEVSFFELPRE